MTPCNPGPAKPAVELDAKLCKPIMIPRWAFHVGMGFFYLSTLCAILSMFVLVGLMAKVSHQASQIRDNQFKNARRIDAVVEEAKEARQEAKAR